MEKKIKIISVVAMLFVLSSAAVYSAVVSLKKFTFDDDKALDKWGRMILNGRVEYKLVKTADNGYVEASSKKACSAIYYRIGFNLKDYPILSWKWRVLKFPDKSKAQTAVEKDDYAARVYVIFLFFNFSSSKFIEYVWDKDLPVGTVLTSPKGDNIKQIVVRSGESLADVWATESRNVYDDYLMAFGKEPSLGVGAIAIMCNADNTKTEAEALFDDIEIAVNKS